MLNRRLAGLLLVCSLLVAPAFADPACIAGNLSTIENTTCDIGGLRFTFGSLLGKNYAYNNETASYDYYNEYSGSDFDFTPVSNGFMLSLLSGPLSITAPARGHAYNYAHLPFSILALNGRLLRGGDTSGGAPSVSLVSGGGYYANSSAGFLRVTNDSSCPPINFHPLQFETVEVFLQRINSVYNSVYSPCRSNYLQAFDRALAYGPIYNYPDQNFLVGSPFPSGWGEAFPFSMYADYGSSAGWSGSTTFTFSLTDPGAAPPVPEPATLFLIGSGLAGLAGVRRRKLLEKRR